MEATMAAQAAAAAAAAAAMAARPFATASAFLSPHNVSSKCSSPSAKFIFSQNTTTSRSTLRIPLHRTHCIRSSGNSDSTDEATDRQLQQPAGQLFDARLINSSDRRDVGSPVVNRYIGEDSEKWLMWYHVSDSSSSSCSIALAVSSNGVHWERAGQVMEPNTDWWAFDTFSVSPSEVLVMSSDKLRPPGRGGAVYWLYYTGLARVAPGETPVPLPGLALSQDGQHWARIEGEHHSGALFGIGDAGQWDSLSVAAPKVVYHSPGDLRMYYHSWDPASRSYAIGIARSRDGMKWAKLGKVLSAGPTGSFDEAGARNGHVVRMRDGKGYLMAYDGVSAEGVVSIGLAASVDGLKHWTRCGDIAVLKPSAEEEDGWDSRRVDSPCLVQMNGNIGDEWRLYYRGTGKDGKTGIGLAVSQGSNQPIRFERWTGFRL